MPPICTGKYTMIIINSKTSQAITNCRYEAVLSESWMAFGALLLHIEIFHSTNTTLYKLHNSLHVQLINRATGSHSTKVMGSVFREYTKAIVKIAYVCTALSASPNKSLS